MITVLAALVISAPAHASLAGEVQAGQQVAAQVQDGRVTCSGLTASQSEHLGEYVMERMVGSREAHDVMNARMRGTIGVASSERMHAFMGRRYAGCATAGGWPAMMHASGWGDWSVVAVVAIVLGAAVVVALIARIATRRRPPSVPSST